eukprot:m.35350 g.35350  ORF g.35350 m.35350 type:complete len:93 (+) comp5715_c0_seq1:501-779(+)
MLFRSRSHSSATTSAGGSMLGGGSGGGDAEVVFFAAARLGCLGFCNSLCARVFPNIRKISLVRQAVHANGMQLEKIDCASPNRDMHPLAAGL